jgi:hypothetical protein
MIEEIRNSTLFFGLIIRNNFSFDGIKFFTPDDFSQQLGYMKRPAGHVIEPHLHNILRREILFTSEVLFVKSGKVQVDFYTDEKALVASRILETGDVILLVEGGHGFKILEECEMIEVKQGPYAGNLDKVRF